MEYIDQCIDSTRYLFTTNKKNIPKNLTKLKTKFISKNKFDISLSILGESHLFLLNFGKFSLVEIVACIKESGINVPNLYRKELDNSIKYKFKSEKIAFKSNNFKDSLNNVFGKISKKEELFLEYIFPNQDSNYLAKTEIYLYFIDNIIILRTVHSYPNKKKVLITESRIKGVLT